MQYMLLIYGNEATFNALPDAEKARIGRETGRFVEGLRANGVLRGGNPLQHVATATTVRFNGGKQLTTDGPFAETKEQLGGYFLIDVPDLDAALAVVARMPECSPHVAVEIRPVLDVGQFK
ncbi:MAG: YciI family protein [Pseudomonadota bacterium]